jgi:hypothetical protein
MKKSVCFGTLVALTLWTAVSSAQGRDLTEAFQSAHYAAGEQQLVERLRAYHVVFVPGFLSNLQLKPEWIVKKFVRVREHFTDQMAWLKKNGISHHRMVSNTELSPLVNGGELAMYLKTVERPVLLVTHSKGGLDALHGLVGWKSVRSKVAGWLALQAPFLGSPIADEVVTHWPWRDLSFTALGIAGGSQESLLSLTTKSAQRYLADNAEEVEAVVDEIPVLCVGSHKPNLPGRDTNLEGWRNYMLKKGLPNDGLVPEKNAVLPGADYVFLEGVDHTAPVSSRPKAKPFPRVELTRDLLSLLFEVSGGT